MFVPMVGAALPAWQLAFDVPGPRWAALPGRATPEGAAVVLSEQPARPAAAPQADKADPTPDLVASRATTLPTPPAIDDIPIIARSPVPTASLASLIGYVWLAGFLAALAWLIGGCLSLLRLTRHCQRVDSGPLCDMLAQTASDLGIRRPISLLLSSKRAIPMTWGVRHPVVLLPETAHTWSPNRLRMVLIHELSHVARNDCLVQMLGHLVRGLYWWHPLAWLAVRQLRIEQEHACDDLVLQSGANAPDYAEHLLAVTAGLSTSFWITPVALGISRATRLRHRLVHLLDAGRRHQPVRRRTLLGTVAIAVTLAVALGAVVLSPSAATLTAAQAKDEAQQPPGDKDGALLKRLAEVQQQLAKHYVTPVNDKVLVDSAINGLLSGLNDPYTAYIPADELEKFDSQIQGALTGIGVQIQSMDQGLTVATPLDGSTGHKAGLRPGDLIEAIDGKSTRGMAVVEAVKLIRGKPGSVVKLKVVHPEGAVAELAVPRAEIRMPSTGGFLRGADGRWQWLLETDYKVGYVRIHQFTARTAAEVRQAVEEAQKQGLKGLILDLRFCPGGLLDQAVEVCKLFLSKGVIVTTRAPGKEEHSFKAEGKGDFADLPLLVLVNDQTASAAEIVSGALRDNERAVLLGSRSFGKGSVQMVMKLDGGGALKFTTAYHYLPSGRNIQKRPGEKTWGVDPSDGFYVPLTAVQNDALLKDASRRALVGLAKDEMPAPQTRLTPKLIEETHADPQLAAALRTMVARITGGEFIKVGKDNAVLVDQAGRLEEMRQRREQLQQNINQLDREMGDLLKK